MGKVTTLHQLCNKLNISLLPLIKEFNLQPTCHYFYHSIIFALNHTYKTQYENINYLPKAT